VLGRRSCAGMNRRLVMKVRLHKSVPRMRGDEPI